jgi:hypothetical protein
MYGGQMRVIALTMHSADIPQILDHIEVDSHPSHISAARGPPLWWDCGDAQIGDGVEAAPDYEIDQRGHW